MENEATVQMQEEPGLQHEDWADAEWFQTWLLLARRDYQRMPPQEELKPVA